MMKKANIVKFVNTDTDDEYYYTIGKSKSINKKTMMVAAVKLRCRSSLSVFLPFCRDCCF